MAKRYDVVVVGSTLSAAITAALLAKRGMRGLLLELDQREDPERATRGGPSAGLWMSDEGSSAMVRVHTELGVREDLRGRMVRLDPSLQWIFDDTRVSLRPSRAQFITELRRAFGTRAAAFEVALEKIDQLERRMGDHLAEMKEIPASGFFARRALRMAMDRDRESFMPFLEAPFLVGQDSALRSFILGPLHFLMFHALDPAALSAGAAARLFGRLLRGLSHVAPSQRDERQERALFLAVAERKGFEIRSGRLESIGVEGRDVRVLLADSRDAYSASALVDATADLSALHAIRGARRPKLQAALDIVRGAERCLVSSNVEIDADVLPPGMGQEVVLVDKPDLPPMWISKHPCDDEQRVLLVVSRVEKRVRPNGDSLQKHAVPRSSEDDPSHVVVRKRLELAFPFFSEGRPEFHERSAFRSEDDRPFLLPKSCDPQLGLAGVPMRTVLKTVLVAGPSVIPGLGFEGGYLSALQTADACAVLLGGVKKPAIMGMRS